jgi:hypothetical protein
MVACGRIATQPARGGFADNGGNFPDLESAGCAIRAIAQITPTISRAIAVLTTTFGLPAAASRRQREHSRLAAPGMSDQGRAALSVCYAPFQPLGVSRG